MDGGWVEGACSTSCLAQARVGQPQWCTVPFAFSAAWAVHASPFALQLKGLTPPATLVDRLGLWPLFVAVWGGIRHSACCTLCVCTPVGRGRGARGTSSKITSSAQPMMVLLIFFSTHHVPFTYTHHPYSLIPSYRERHTADTPSLPERQKARHMHHGAKRRLVHCWWLPTNRNPNYTPMLYNSINVRCHTLGGRLHTTKKNKEMATPTYA